MKRRFFIIFILSILCMILLATTTYSVIGTGNISINRRGANQFDNVGSRILSTVRVIGMLVSIGALMIIGIRYMISSTEEKALEKENMIYYIIGAVLVFAIVNIVSAVYDVLK